MERYPPLVPNQNLQEVVSLVEMESCLVRTPIEEIILIPPTHFNESATGESHCSKGVVHNSGD